jgi:taurine transport system permease protein
MIWDMEEEIMGRRRPRNDADLLVYVAIFVGAFFVVKFVVHKHDARFHLAQDGDLRRRKRRGPNRSASIISVLTIFLIWGSFTGSLVPGFLHAPGPFVGETSFTYTLEDESGAATTPR